MSARVWIADKMSARAVEVFRSRGIEVDYKPGLNLDEQIAIAGNYEAIVVRSTSSLKGALLDAAARVRVIGRAGIGVDNIDVPTCSRRGVVVMNTPFGNTITTAELAVAHIMAAARQIPQATASTRAGKWEKNRFMGMELTGKRAGVIGAGNIGAIVCDRLQGLHMQVLVYDPFISDERAAAMGVTKVATVAELAEQVDVLTIHVPLLDATRNLIDAGIIGRMKRGSIVVNCARGGIVDEDALYAALKSGHLRAAALDVFAHEPAKENKLFELENLSCTPHIGASTDEAQENVAVQIAEQIADFLLLGSVANAVNVPSLSEEEYRHLEPFNRLVTRLGLMLGHLAEPGFSRLTVAFEGEVAALNRKPLLNAALHGLLSSSSEDVNSVNARLLAQERGIEVSEIARDHSDHFNSLVRLEVEGKNGRHSVAGTVFDGSKPRLVAIDNCEIELTPSGRMIFLRNEDKPGVIAAIGTILARANINIGDFRLGRQADNSSAVALISVDSRPESSVLAELQALDFLRTVRYLELDN